MNTELAAAVESHSPEISVTDRNAAQAVASGIRDATADSTCPAYPSV